MNVYFTFHSKSKNQKGYTAFLLFSEKVKIGELVLDNFTLSFESKKSGLALRFLLFHKKVKIQSKLNDFLLLQ